VSASDPVEPDPDRVGLLGAMWPEVIEGTGRKVHENVTVTRHLHGALSVEWHDGPPQPGDRLLMSVELFEQMIEQYNQNVAALGVVQEVLRG